MLDLGRRPTDWWPRSRHDNQLWRLHAQRLLVERGKTDVVPALVELAGDQSVDAIGLNTGVIHALWTLHGLGALADVRPRRAAGCHGRARAPVGRSSAQRGAGLAAQRAIAPSAVLAAGLLRDPDAQVRLAALLCLADQPPSDEVGVAVAEALRGGLATSDQWLADAAMAAARATTPSRS